MRLCQFLRSPDFDSNGGSLADEYVSISRAELEELKAKVAETTLSMSDLAESSSARAEFTKELKTREAVHSREIADREQKAADLERAYKSAVRDRELATSLIGKPLVAGAAAQLIKLWRDDFEVIDDDGEIRILAKDGRGVVEAVAERLAGAEFAHFCLPSSRGGTGAKGQNRSATPAPPPSGPRTLGESVLQQWRETASRPQTSPTPTGWGRRR
jgi:hypothetical protein